jgi:hypothetical protein
MIEILIEYPFDEDDDLTITMIHEDIPVVEICFSEYNVIERKFIKTDPNYHKFSTYIIRDMKLRKYGWGCDSCIIGPVVECDMRGYWGVYVSGLNMSSEHDINFDNVGPIWVEMLEDYRQMKIDVKRLNSQNQ